MCAIVSGQTQNHRNRAECPQNQDQIIPKTDAKKAAFKRDEGEDKPEPPTVQNKQKGIQYFVP